MLKKGQPHFDARPGHGADITTLAYEFKDDHVVPDHYHRHDQLIYACHGVMTVRTRDGIWVVPSQRAVWVPAMVIHGIKMSGAVSMRTLYLRPGLAPSLPETCCLVNVSPLLRELILHLCRFPILDRRVKTESHLIEVIIDQLEAVRSTPLQLPSPSDPRAARVAEALLSDPSEQRPLAEICRTAGASKKTIERLFLQETQMTFGRWRQQLRLMHAMRLLAKGEKIANTALEVGYSTPSAFISMFRKTLGTTPGRYFGE